MDHNESGGGPCPAAGGRPRRENHYQAEAAAAAYTGLPDGEDRYAVVRALREVGRQAGWNNRLIAHLELLIGYTRPQDWWLGHRPIVYLKVQTAAHKLGISVSQIQRNERRLMELGAIAFRDSGNFRRSGRRDGDGRLLEAWGLDLSPCAALLPELRRLVEQAAREREEFLKLKREISAARRRIRAALDCAVADSRVAGDAPLRAELERLGGRVRERTPLDELRRRLAGLTRLDERVAAEIGVGPAASGDAPEAVGNSADPVGNSGDFVENPVPSVENPVDRPADLMPCAAFLRPPAAENAAQGPQECGTQEYYNTNREGTLEKITVAEGRRERRAGSRTAGGAADGERPIAFSVLLDLLGDEFLGYLPPGRRIGWSDLIDAASRVAEDLGISAHAWREASYRLGRQTATVAVIVIAAKKARGLIASPGGYLRGIVRRGVEGDLRLDRSVFGLAKDAFPLAAAGGVPAPSLPGRPSTEEGAMQ